MAGRTQALARYARCRLLYYVTMHRLHRILARLQTFVGSTAGFYAVLTLFTLSALWVASFSLYPMAFDEEFHYGLIKIYTTSLLPYGIPHTSDMAQYGAATADASYLFQYLMSFPYRLFDLLGFTDTAIIIVLRYMNVAMVVAALILFHRALLALGASRTAAALGLAFVSLIPVFIMLAAQINYDNLLLLVTAWCLLLTFRITSELREHRRIPLRFAWQLIIALLIGMSIKYAFLPIALAIGLWLIGMILRSYWPAPRSWPTAAARSLNRQWRALSRRSQLIHISLSVLSLFFASHYVTNVVSYGSPIPACDQVFTEVECQAYGPWSRNKLYTAEKQASFRPLSYPAYMAQEWFPGMTERLTFTLAGKTNGFQTKPPLPIVIYGFIIVSIIGTGCLLFQLFRRGFRLPWPWTFTLLLTFTYVGALSYQLYGDYIETARPVAINGRYLLPLLPLVALMLMQAMRQSAARISSPALATIGVLVFLFILIGGGGIGTYIVQSEPHWYWNGFAQSAYETVHPIFDTLAPLRFTD